MPMFKLVQEMMFVNKCVKFRHNRLRNEVCRAVTPLGHVRTNVRTGRSLYYLFQFEVFPYLLHSRRFARPHIRYE